MNTLVFTNHHKISMVSDYADTNPNMDMDAEWAVAASHWKCRFRRGNQCLTTYFSMGSAHIGNPKAADVLDCLASDAASIENARSFEDWCSDFGYDTDSRRAERTFKTCERQAHKLKQFLGPDLYDTLPWNTERL